MVYKVRCVVSVGVDTGESASAEHERSMLAHLMHLLCDKAITKVSMMTREPRQLILTHLLRTTSLTRLYSGLCGLIPCGLISAGWGGAQRVPLTICMAGVWLQVTCCLKLQMKGLAAAASRWSELPVLPGERRVTIMMRPSRTAPRTQHKASSTLGTTLVAHR